jgi:hypothetical protein
MIDKKYGTDEKRMKHFTKCTFCGKCDDVQYLSGLEWFCNKRCHYNYRHKDDSS